MPPNLRHVAMKVLDNLGIIKRSEEGDHITFLFGDATYTIKTRISFSNDGEIIIYSWPEFTIPAECRKKAIEYLNRRNFSSKIGCLEMDVNDGEVRYRTCVRHGEATSVEGILTTFMAMHQGYFARTIYPKLVKLRDPTDISTIENLLS